MSRLWLAAAFFVVVGSANAADLSLQQVMLLSGGVGYFEYEVTVDGNATLNLDVPIDQVDDILKSLVVYDDSGTAGEITLPGREPLTQSFVDLPFDRTALESAPALLNALLRFCRPRSATPISVIPDEIVSGAARPKHARICPT